MQVRVAKTIDYTVIHAQWIGMRKWEMAHAGIVFLHVGSSNYVYEQGRSPEGRWGIHACTTRNSLSLSHHTHTHTHTHWMIPHMFKSLYLFSGLNLSSLTWSVLRFVQPMTHSRWRLFHCQNQDQCSQRCPPSHSPQVRELYQECMCACSVYS